MGKSADETVKRQHAVNLYQKGCKVSDICCQLNRSRTWFYKWLRRYQSGQLTWFEDVSKTPHKIANKTPLEAVELVLKIRSDLENTKGSRIGAKSIQSRLVILGWNSVSIRTINRILKTYQVTRKQVRQSQTKPLKQSAHKQNLKQLSLF